MKYIVDIKHVSIDLAKEFENRLKKAVSEFQNKGYLVEIQQGYMGRGFTAVVIAYVIKQPGDVIQTNL